MADSKGTISSITINKLDKGCTVRVEKFFDDKKAYDGKRFESKNYTADDDLLKQVLAYVDAEVEDAEIENDLEEGGKKKLNPKTFLKSSK